MSSHKRNTKRFSRRNGPRKMLLKGLLVNLIESQKIVTTEAKAKELKRHFDKLVTLAKKQDMNSLRLIIGRLSNRDAAKKLYFEMVPTLKSRTSGYTSVIKMPNRKGDNSPMAFIQVL